MISEYAIEEAGDPERLAELIKLRLRDGWQLQGGVSMIRYTFETSYGGHDTGWWYAQALTRSEDRP
jgi:hypothetical protein